MMSSKSLSISINYFSKIFSVDTNGAENLPDYVKRIRREKGLSTTDVERNSRKGGAKGVSNGYVSQIENNYIQNVSPEKLKALGKGLGVSEEEIFSVARGKTLELGKISNERFAFIADGYANLDEQERKSIEPLITAIELTVRASAVVAGKTTIKAKGTVETSGKSAPVIDVNVDSKKQKNTKVA